jgi:mitochondrial fission protein ELM1
LKKFKHIWIFSDSISGHEIQSQALASQLSDNVDIYHCTLRQPWLSFAPRILPRFGRNIIWEHKSPNKKQAPDAIITCGRRMAAIGKYYKQQLHCKHIQILNPGDNPKNYDVLVCPEHDRITGSNIVTSLGSIHNISKETLSAFKCEIKPKETVCILLGNPAKGFFKNLNQLAIQINQYTPNHDVMICASRRTAKKHHPIIKKVFAGAKILWLDTSDGENPYHKLLANSSVLMVTADSVNMVSEACAGDKCVIAIAQNNISPKHKRFIDSIKHRLSTIDNLKVNNTPLNTLDKVTKEIIRILTD